MIVIEASRCLFALPLLLTVLLLLLPSRALADDLIPLSKRSTPSPSSPPPSKSPSVLLLSSSSSTPSSTPETSTIISSPSSTRPSSPSTPRGAPSLLAFIGKTKRSPSYQGNTVPTSYYQPVRGNQLPANAVAAFGRPPQLAASGRTEYVALLTPRSPGGSFAFGKAYFNASNALQGDFVVDGQVVSSSTSPLSFRVLVDPGSLDFRFRWQLYDDADLATALVPSVDDNGRFSSPAVYVQTRGVEHLGSANVIRNEFVYVDDSGRATKVWSGVLKQNVFVLTKQRCSCSCS